MMIGFIFLGVCPFWKYGNCIHYVCECFDWGFHIVIQAGRCLLFLITRTSLMFPCVGLLRPFFNQFLPFLCVYSIVNHPSIQHYVLSNCTPSIYDQICVCRPLFPDILFAQRDACQQTRAIGTPEQWPLIPGGDPWDSGIHQRHTTKVMS